MSKVSISDEDEFQCSLFLHFIPLDLDPRTKMNPDPPHWFLAWYNCLDHGVVRIRWWRRFRRWWWRWWWRRHGHRLNFFVLNSFRNLFITSLLYSFIWRVKSGIETKGCVLVQELNRYIKYFAVPNNGSQRIKSTSKVFKFLPKTNGLINLLQAMMLDLKSYIQIL